MPAAVVALFLGKDDPALLENLVATSLDGLAREREMGSLLWLLRQDPSVRVVILTIADEGIVTVGKDVGLSTPAQIEVIPAWKWLLG